MKIKITGTKGYIVETLLPYLQKKYPSADVRAISVRDANVDLSGTDILIHVAGLIPGKATNSKEYYRINHGLTVKLAEQAKCVGVKHMIYFSTIAVYGRVPLIKNKVTFEEGTEQPATPYGDSKLQAERALRRLETDEFKVAILRIPDVYGNKNIDYLQRYINIANKYYKVGGYNPIIWNNKKRSAVHIDNLIACVQGIIEECWSGVLIPHDREPLSTYEYIQLISRIRQMKLKSSKPLGWGVWILQQITGKFEFFYGSFDASNDLKAPFSYQMMTAAEACEITLEKLSDGVSMDESEDY